MSTPKASNLIINPDDARQFDVIFPDGTRVEDLNSDDDIRRAKDLFGERFATAAPLDFPVLPLQTLAAIAAQRAAEETKKRRGKAFADVVKLYKKEKALDNTARTLTAKQAAFDDFAAKAGERPMDAYALDDAVDHKNRPIEAGGSASRINSKLSYLRDLFAYALANGQHPGPNPF